jgi:hypothetical protein
MKARRSGLSRIMLIAGVLSLLVLPALFYINSTITPLDRPFFLSGNKQTITVTYVDWMCNCPDFVEITKFNRDPIVEAKPTDYFFLEPASRELKLDRNHFINHKFVRLTGQFYLDKGIPTEFELGATEDKPDHARIFRYERIEYIQRGE